jgi:hypothetical protein
VPASEGSSHAIGGFHDFTQRSHDMTKARLATLFAILSLPVCGILIAGQTKPPDATSQNPGDKPRVGVYDSRAVAVAYCGTDRHEAEIRRLDEALAKAKRSGDAAQIKKADRAVWEARKRMHRQGFSTHPVDDILKLIPEDVKRIEKEAKVTGLVSKWDAKKLAEHKKAEKVDVTGRLIDALKPGERQRRMAKDIMKVKPIPPKQYEEILRKEAGEHY